MEQGLEKLMGHMINRQSHAFECNSGNNSIPKVALYKISIKNYTYYF